jgi:hypothetical protein
MHGHSSSLSKFLDLILLIETEQVPEVQVALRKMACTAFIETRIAHRLSFSFCHGIKTPLVLWRATVMLPDSKPGYWTLVCFMLLIIATPIAAPTTFMLTH